MVRRDVRFEEDMTFRSSWELGDREPSTIQQQQQQSSSQVTGGQGTRGTTVTLTGPSVSSSQVPVSRAQGSPSSAQSGSLDTSQISPPVGSTHGTSGSSAHPGTGSGSPGSVGQPRRAPSSDDEEFFDVPTPQGEVDSRKRRPKWLQDSLKEAETVGAPKKQVRERRPPDRFGSYIAMVTDIIETKPSSYEEASSHSMWRESMAKDYASIMKNDVWEVVPKPEGKSVVTSKWLYKIKYVDGSIEKYKARFVARGFSQVEGIDYDETFAPIAQYTSIRSIISIAAEMGWKIH